MSVLKDESGRFERQHINVGTLKMTDSIEFVKQLVEVEELKRITVRLRRNLWNTKCDLLGLATLGC